MLDGLASGDFPTRKASADTLATLATRLGPAMIPFRDEVLVILEDLRFDKVKPVRESVVAAVEAFKGLSAPGTPALSDERPKTPTRSRTPIKKYPFLLSFFFFSSADIYSDSRRSSSFGALPVNASANKAVPSHTIHVPSKPPPNFGIRAVVFG